MNAGDLVKVLHNDTWQEGNVVEDKGRNIKVTSDINKFSKNFPRKNVKRFIKAKDEEVELFHKLNFGEIYNQIRLLLHKFFPDKKIEVTPEHVIVVDNFTISPCVVEVNSIGAVRELPGWNIDVSHYYDGHDGLRDVDVCDLGKSRSSNGIVMLLMKGLFEQEVKSFLDNNISL